MGTWLSLGKLGVRGLVVSTDANEVATSGRALVATSSCAVLMLGTLRSSPFWDRKDAALVPVLQGLVALSVEEWAGPIATSLPALVPNSLFVARYVPCCRSS